MRVARAWGSRKEIMDRTAIILLAIAYALLIAMDVIITVTNV